MIQRYLGQIIYTSKDTLKFYGSYESTKSISIDLKCKTISSTENDTFDFKEALKSDLSSYAVLLNSPWSQSCKTYEISVNCKDGYTEIAKDVPIWKCDYIVTGYDGIQSSIRGYGDDPVSALKDCQNAFRMIQTKYNPTNECI